MNYRKIIIAHKAFYEIEPRANYYDNYLNSKTSELWRIPELPIDEVEKLFEFIIHWDYHFKGDKNKFIENYRSNFTILNELNTVNLLNLDIKNQQTLGKIKTVFSCVANCSIGGRFESTDASKILQTINPGLFVMWDRRIRKGILGDENMMYSQDYAGSFIPFMKGRLDSVLLSIIEERGGDSVEALNYLESCCDGKTAAKLLDEYNYVVNTMRDKFDVFLKKIGLLGVTEFLKEDDLKIEIPKIKLVDKNEYSDFISLLNLVKNKGLIGAEERRRIEKEWRENPDLRLDLIERLTFLKSKIL